MRHRSFFIGKKKKKNKTVAGLAQALGGHIRVIADLLWAAVLARYTTARGPGLRSSAALVMDQREGVVLYGLNESEQRPIASVSKLMTSMVTLDAELPMG